MATLTSVTDRTTGKKTNVRSEMLISDDLALPVDAVTQVIGFLGRRGSGKTYAATKLAELMLDAHAQIVVLDPVGVWYGLRLGDGYDIPVLGGLHGDVPLEPSSGALVADLIVDRGISAILDVSQMIPADLARFALGFGDRFFQRKKAAPSAVSIIMEECQEFVPENPQRGGLEPKVLHAFQRIVKLGRNFGIGCCLISQRPQEISKKVMNQTELLFAFQTSGPQERTAIKRWIDDKGLDEDIKSILPKLEIGQTRAWSPQWLKISKTIRIAPKRSLDASSTPKVGVRAEAVKTLTPIDLEALRDAMAETVERSKQDDPKYLRACIAEMAKRIADLEAAKPNPTIKTVRVEIPVLTQEHHNAIVELSEACFKVADLAGWKGPLAEIRERIAVLSPPHFTPLTVEHRLDASPVQTLEQKSGLVRSPKRMFEQSAAARFGNQPESRESRLVGGERIKHARAIREANGATPRNSGEVTLKKGQEAVMTVIAQYPAGVSRRQISIITRHAASTRNRLIYELKSLGCVGEQGDLIVPTETGIAALGNFEPLPTGAALRAHWYRELPEGNRRVLEVVCKSYPKAVSRDAISDATGHATSTRNRLIYELAARQLVETEGSMIRASRELFD